MTGHRTLTSALASVEAEMWATTPFGAVGVVVPAGDGRLRIESRERALATAHVLDRSEVPSLLTPPLAAPASVAPLAPVLNPDRAVDRMMTLLNLDALTAVPFGTDGGGVFWAATAGDAPGPDVEIVKRWADRVAAASREPEPLEALEDRLSRIDALAALLQPLSSALDIRDVFGQLSEIARRVLPHDTAIVGVGIGDMRRIRLHALSVPTEWQLPAEIENPYPIASTEGWDFAMHHDLAAHSVERHRPPAQLGLRSSLRLPIWLDGRVQGALDLSSFAVNHFGDRDIAIGRRIADYIALALSHQRLADEAHEAAAAHESAAHLEVLDGLLKTLAGVLDVRDVFDRVSQISEKVMTHDAMSISLPSPDGQRWTIHVANGALGHLVTPFEMRQTPTPRLLNSYWDFELVDDMPAQSKYDGTPSVEAGMVALLSIPVWVESRLRATVNFYSRRKGHFTTDDVLVGRRIADHIALVLSHQRLAEEAQRSVSLRARAANLELVDQLVATLTDSGELPDVFDRISAIAKRVLPHDMLVLPVMLPDGVNARLYARSGAAPGATQEVVPIPATLARNDNWEFDLVDDMQAHPEQRTLRPARDGYRSALRIPIRLDGTFVAALVCFSLQPSVYSHADVAVARRIADRVALVLARERGAEVSRRAADAAARAARLEARVRALSEELDARTGYRKVIGESASWRQVLTQATQVAATDTTVLLLGESGTGKEVIARLVHRASSRGDGPFVALNCAALPEHLLEAELFGYERGAFTGATQSKPGQLEQAAGGTLFLDEVGEMSLPAQAKFLRVLQEREFQRLGGTRILKSDARVVAATNRDLQRAMERREFREDLYYRLNVFAIHLPPLRKRPDDVWPLGEAFVAEFGRSLGRPPRGISREARAMLEDYPWPGNVRELRNILERAAILCDGGLILPEHLALVHAPPAAASAARVEPSVATVAPPAAPSAPVAPAGDLKSMERTMLEAALRDARFNKSKAAKALGLTRAQLYVRMKRYGLE